jgi:tRNA1Val (adenine37-N6)-methyltransferase
VRETTLDSVLGGRAAVCQHRDGYRFGLDSVLLGVGAAHLARRRVLDACCGSGVVGLTVLAARGLVPTPTDGAALEVVGVELQEGLAALAAQNAQRNGVEGAYRVLRMDARALRAEEHGRFDLILLNPPYFRPGESVPNPDPERAQARHELAGDLEALLDGCRRVLAPNGRLRLVYPAGKLPRVMEAVRGGKLKVGRLRLLHSRAQEPAYGCLVDVRQQGEGFEVAPPIFLYEGEGSRGYAPAVEAALRGEVIPAW